MSSMNNFMTGPRGNGYQYRSNRFASSTPYNATHFNRGTSSKTGNQWVRAKVQRASQIDGPILSGPSIKSWKRTTTTTTDVNPDDKPKPTANESRIPGEASAIPLIADTSTVKTSAAAVVDGDKLAAHTLATLDTLPQTQDRVAVELPAHAATQLLRKGTNKLVRRSEQSSAIIMHRSSSSAGSGEVVTELQQHPKSDLTASRVPSAKPVMKRYGPNKLVLKKDLPIGSTALQKMTMPPNNTTATITSNATAIAVNGDAPAGMKLKGRNKLVSQARLDEERQLKQSLKRKRQELKESVQVAGLTHKGRNKLVSESRALQVEEQLKEKLKQRLLEAKRNRSNGPVKRVRIQDDSDEATKTKLTDFAYQHTSQSHRRNMGLIRVVPKADAPICPTFSRGLPCTKPNCTKRHDVPIESSTPICSFFQRNGQCLKRETCPFRHIKVNPHATLCAQFNLLGYCDDPECLFKHAKERKQNI